MSRDLMTLLDLASSSSLAPGVADDVAISDDVPGTLSVADDVNISVADDVPDGVPEA